MPTFNGRSIVLEEKAEKQVTINEQTNGQSMSKSSKSGASKPINQMALGEVLDRLAVLAREGQIHRLSPQEHRLQVDHLIAKTKRLQKKLHRSGQIIP